MGDATLRGTAWEWLCPESWENCCCYYSAHSWGHSRRNGQTWCDSERWSKLLTPPLSAKRTLWISTLLVSSINNPFNSNAASNQGCYHDIRNQWLVRGVRTSKGFSSCTDMLCVTKINNHRRMVKVAEKKKWASLFLITFVTILSAEEHEMGWGREEKAASSRRFSCLLVEAIGL